MVRGFAPVPTTALFRDFCSAKVVAALPPALQAPQRERVVRLEPLAGGAGTGGW